MENDTLKIVLDFAEGRMTAEEFWDEFQKNKDLKKEMLEDLEKNKIPGAYFDPIDFLNNKVISLSYGNSLDLYGIAKRILIDNYKTFNPTTFYNDRYSFLIKIQPDWLDISDSNEKYLIDVVAAVPSNLNESAKIKWCREKIKEHFKYENKPPRWVQSPEWPIKNGKPLVFKNQSRERKESELVKFFFYNPETNEEVVVKQYY